MDRIIDVDDVQGELDRAARDAKHGPADVRAGRFVHAHERHKSATSDIDAPTAATECGKMG